MPLSFKIPPIDSTASAQIDSKILSLGLPKGSLGLLEDVIRKLVCIQDSDHIELQQLRHLVFCCDHGIYERSHHGQPPPVASVEHVRRILAGKAPVATICALHNVELTVIDCGLHSEELLPQRMFISHKIAHGTRDLSSVEAMTEAQLDQAVQLGCDQASLQMAEGAKVLSFGALGLGNTTSASAITMALLPLSAEAVVVNQNKHDPNLHRDKIEVLTQAMALHKDKIQNGWDAVRYLGGFEIAAIMGAMLATAELGGMFLVDGYACSAALLALSQMYPNITDYAQFSHQSAHVAQHKIMAHLNQRPLLNLHLGLGEGTGSILAWPLITSIVSCLQEEL